MHYSQRFLCVVLCCVAASMLPSCRSVGSVLGNPDAELRTGQWWAGPLPDTTPIRAQHRVAWVSYRNATQESAYDLGPALADALIAQGYTISSDPDTAQFHVFYTLRFAGDNPRTDEGRSLAAGLGAIGGGGTGALIARAAGGGTPALIGGGLGGVVAGALAGVAIENYARVVEYDLILDVRLAQRQKTQVTRSLTGTRLTRQDTGTHARTAGGTVGGVAAATLQMHQEVQEKDAMLWHENRLVLWARQMRLAPEEATPALTRALLRTLPQILP